MKLVIYARYSSAEHQDESSLATQLRNCRALAEREGHEIVRVFKDEGITGTDDNRPEYVAMQRFLADGGADGVVTNETSRLSRSDNGELLRFMADLASRDQCVLAPNFDSRQELAPLLAAMMSGMNSLEVAKLRRRTRDALRMRAERGYAAGTAPYGYRTQPSECGKYRVHVIHEPEAEVVRTIFGMAADGLSDRAIAAELNCQGVPSSGRRRQKKRRKWMHSTIRGVLRNETYVGRLVFNKFRVRRAPGSGRKQRQRLPESEWVRAERPELRIVSDEVWSRVQERIAAAAARTDAQRAQNKNSGGRPYRRLLSGLLKCAECGYNYVISDQVHYACASHRSGGPHACGNAMRVRRTLAEQRILGTLTEELLSEERIKKVRTYAAQYVRRLKAEARTESGDADRIRAQIAETDRRIANVAEAIADGALRESTALVAKLRELETEREQLLTDLAASNSSKLDALPDLVPDLLRRYREQVANMASLGDHPNARHVVRARTALRSLLGDVVLRPAKGHLVAHVALQNQVLPLVADDVCQRWCPGQDSNL